MNAAWGGVADSSRIAMYLSGGHKTVKNILKRGAFTVSMGDAEHAAACDYVGIESGNSVPDKVARAGFHVTKSEHVDAPVIDEFPLALECKLVSYDEETRLLTGEIVNVSVDERALEPRLFRSGRKGRQSVRRRQKIQVNPAKQKAPRPVFSSGCGAYLPFRSGFRLCLCKTDALVLKTR